MSEYQDPGTVPQETDAVAVVGMALRVPGSADPESFWEKIVDGVVSLPAATAPGGTLRAGQIDRFDRFDAELFGMLPAQAAVTDPQHRVLTEVAWQALEDAGVDPARTPGRVAVFVGCGTEAYYRDHVLKDEKTVRALGAEQLALGNSRDFLATGLAYRLGLTGPAVTVQTACSTSLVAVHQAIRSLLTYECDIAIAGGATVHPDAEPSYEFTEGGITSPDGRCRAFTEGSAGTAPSSGAGIVVLRRAADLPGTGESARAHLVGSAVNNDGVARMSFTAPSPQGQADVLREALATAGLEPADVGYVETHGTGTVLGDQVELAALAEVYGQRPAGAGLALGSVKPNIGHCDTAAGVIGLIKAVLALEAGVLPPTPAQPGDGPDANLGAADFELPRHARPWPADRPRNAGVSSFGLGGTNCHVLLSAAPRPGGGQPAEQAQPHLAVISAATPEALRAKARDLAAWLADRTAGPSVGELTATLWHHRRALPQRWAAALPEDPVQAREHLLTALTTLAENGGGRRAEPAPSLAAVLPGQGVDLAGAGAQLAAHDAEFAHDLAELAGEVLRAGGPDLSDARSWPSDDARLLDTAVIQPLLFTLGLAGLRHAARHGLEPGLLLGHSLGELTAATYAGVFSVADAAAAVVRRGRLMAAAAPGRMTAVRAGEDTALRLAAGLEVDVCVLNGPQNTVCGGPEAALAAFEERCEQAGIRATRLPVTRAGHSRAMAGAAEEFEAFVATLKLSAPALPIVSGLTGALLTASQAVDPAHWGSQLSKPVRFADAVVTLLESGPDTVLGLHRAHAATAEVRRAALAAQREVLVVDAAGHRGHDEVADWRDALAALWTAGHSLAGPARPARAVRLPSYPFADDRHWVEAPSSPTPAFAAPATAAAPPAELTSVDQDQDPAADAEPAAEVSTADAVRALWQEAFGVPALRPDDNFFDLGGTSLHAAHLVSVVNDALVVEIRLQDLYQNSSLAAFTARTEELVAQRDEDALLRLLEEIENENGQNTHE
ncbi:type I polyketide synthase [Streptomyces hundungensis]|uniref:type I polyketide synthase n=1 Tax=Streptomyces hundungensis TaxID=1077946 RepID=UPI0033DC6B11